MSDEPKKCKAKTRSGKVCGRKASYYAQAAPSQTYCGQHANTQSLSGIRVYELR